MEIEYKSVTGNTVTIEIDDKLGNIILEIEHAEKLNNRAETRRHERLRFFDKDFKNMDEDSDVYGKVSKNLEKDKLYSAIAKLSLKDQELLHKLYLSPNTMTQAKYAKQLGIQEKKRARKI